LALAPKPFTFTLFPRRPDAGATAIFGEAGQDIILGQQADDTIYAGDQDDDVGRP
jgi:hypothetical protein